MSSPDGSGGWGSGGWGSNPYGSGEPGSPGYPDPFRGEQAPRSAYQGFGVFEHGRQANWAQPGPSGQPPRRGRGLVITLVTLAVVLVLGGATTAVVLNSRASSSQAASAPPSATSAPTTTTSTAPSTTIKDPSEQQTFVAPVVAGWRGIAWPTYGVAYDIPPSWQPKPGTQLGVGDDSTPDHVLVSAASLYLENYCVDSRTSYRGLTGITSSPDKDTTAAATNLIDKWAHYGFTSPSGAGPKVSKAAPQQLRMGTTMATLASATITPAAGVPCAAPTEAISVLALPSTNGSALVVALGDQGFTGAVSPQDLQRIVTSLRRIN